MYVIFYFYFYFFLLSRGLLCSFALKFCQLKVSSGADIFCQLKVSLPSLRRQWHPTPVLLPGKSHGQRSLVGCNPWGCTESDATEWLHFHFSLSCIGEGNDNPLQCSCLENSRDRGAWWAAVYGVAQSRTQLKRLSSSSSSSSWHGIAGAVVKFSHWWPF